MSGPPSKSHYFPFRPAFFLNLAENRSNRKFCVKNEKSKISEYNRYRKKNFWRKILYLTDFWLSSEKKSWSESKTVTLAWWPRHSQSYAKSRFRMSRFKFYR